MKKNNTNSKKASKWISIKHEKKVKIWVVSYSVLVNDVDDDDELPIFLAVVDESNPPDLNVPLERLNMERRKRKFFRLEIENYKEKKKKKWSAEERKRNHHFRLELQRGRDGGWVGGGTLSRV